MDRCPLCGAEASPAARGRFECGTAVWLRDDGTLRHVQEEGHECLRRQLAQRDAEIARLRRESEAYMVVGLDYPPAQKKQLDRLISLTIENARLRAIVDKLPKTADGVPVVVGKDTVWEIEQESILRGIEVVGSRVVGVRKVLPLDPADRDYCGDLPAIAPWQIRYCYSTEAAAQEAAAKLGNSVQEIKP